MVNPKSLVYQLYQHWDFVEAMMRYSRDYPELNTEQAIALVGKVDPSCQDPHSVLRTLTNAEVLHIVHRSGEINLNPVVLDFVRSLTHEHELG